MCMAMATSQVPRARCWRTLEAKCSRLVTNEAPALEVLQPPFSQGTLLRKTSRRERLTAFRITQ